MVRERVFGRDQHIVSVVLCHVQQRGFQAGTELQFQAAAKWKVFQHEDPSTPLPVVGNKRANPCSRLIEILLMQSAHPHLAMQPLADPVLPDSLSGMGQ